MQATVAAFVTRYLSRQAQGGGSANVEKSIEFIHRIRVGVSETLSKKNYPAESIPKLQERVKNRLKEIDKADAGVRSFRVEDALRRLPSRVPDSVLSLLRVLVEQADQDPLLADEGLSSSAGAPPVPGALSSPDFPQHRPAPPLSRRPKHCPYVPDIVRPSEEDDASGESDARKHPPRRVAQRSTSRRRRRRSSESSAALSQPRPHSYRRGDSLQPISHNPYSQPAPPFPIHSSPAPLARRGTAPDILIPGRASPGAVAGGTLAPPGSHPSAKPTQGPYWGEVPQGVILRDLLYPLQGINGQFIKWHEPTKAFLLRRDVVISAPVRHLVARIAGMGSAYRRIREIIDSHLLPTPDPPEVQRAWWTAAEDAAGPVLDAAARTDRVPLVTIMPSSATGDPQGDPSSAPVVTFPSTAVEEESPRLGLAFAKRHGVQPQSYARPVPGLTQAAWTQLVRDLLAQYYQALSEVEAKLLEVIDSLGPDFPTRTVDISTGSTLRQLLVTFDDVRERIVILAETTEAVYQLKGAPLLRMLYDVAWRGDELGRTMLTMAITEYVLPVWERQLTEWLTHGTVEDPYDEFFIGFERVAKDGKNLEHLWKHHAWVYESRLLPFVDTHLATLCLHAGLLQCLLRGAEELQQQTADTSAATPTRRFSTLSLLPSVSPPPEDVEPDWTDQWDSCGIAAVLSDAEYVVSSCTRMRWRVTGATHSKAAVLAGKAAARKSIKLPAPDLAAAIPLMESLRERIGALVSQRSAILVNELFVRHQLLQHLHLVQRVILLQQGDFALALCKEALDGELRQHIDKLTDHQLGRILNAAVMSSSVKETPQGALQRLSLQRLPTSGKGLAAFQAVTLRWNATGTAARLLLTEDAAAVLERLQAVAWRLTVAAQTITWRSWPTVQTFRRRFLPIPLCSKLKNPPQILEALDEEGYLATFMCETLQTQLSHVIQVLRQHLVQDFATSAWLYFIKDMRKLTECYTETTKIRADSIRLPSPLQPEQSSLTLRHSSLPTERLHPTSVPKKIPFDRLMSAYEDYLASLAVGWFLKENKHVPLPTATEILSGDAEDDCRRPILTAILRLSQLCSEFADVVDVLYPRFLDFVTSRPEGASVTLKQLEQLQLLLNRTCSEISRLLAALDDASRESDLSEVDPIESERSSLFVALRTNLNLLEFFNEGNGMEKLQSVAAQLISERKEPA